MPGNLQFAAAIVLLTLGCGGHQTAEGDDQSQVDVASFPPRVLYDASREIHCYSDFSGGFRDDQLKLGRVLNDRDIAVLAALYNDVVAPGLTILTIEKGDQRQTPRFTVSLATWDEHDIVPPAQFLESITPRGYEVRGPGESVYYWGADCELRLWAWIADDSASVEVTASSQSRTALVFLEDGRWKACGSKVFALIDEIRSRKVK